jgi:hypothetical protein
MSPGACCGVDLTVVIATHNRPEVLKLTLASLIAQTFRHWTALVIGDCCDSRTGEAVSSIGDSRIRFVNLPARCGDQSGPNWVGATLCQTPYLALLNHDDLLVADHFELCLERLKTSGADMCLGTTAWVFWWREDQEGLVPQYQVIPRAPLQPVHAILPADARWFEPVSAWVMRTDAYRRAGDWKDPSELYRTPFNDWLLRVSRAGLQVVYSWPLSVIKVETHYAQEPVGLAYRASSVVHLRIVHDMGQRSPDVFRKWVVSGSQQQTRARRAALLWKWNLFLSAPFKMKPVVLVRRIVRPMTKLTCALLRPVLALIFEKTDRDLYDTWCRLLGRRRGWWQAASLRSRTGEAPPPPADRLRLLAAARAALAASDGAA